MPPKKPISEMKKICVYGASSSRIPNIYTDGAYSLGRLAAAAGITIIHGGGSDGIMGYSTKGCVSGGGHVIGIIPEFMVKNGWHDSDVELLVTKDIHERKEKMASLSDACIAMPGGCGTLEELLEIITWKQLGLYSKNIVILNINGYFDPLLEMLNKAIDQKFMRNEHSTLWKVAQTPEEAITLAVANSKFDIQKAIDTAKI